MASSTRISKEELGKALSAVEEKERKDPKRKWVTRLMRSALQYHKICPYYDKKTVKCFLQLGEKCDRDGRFENCPVFIKFLEQKYDEYVSKGRTPPMDFLDLTLGV